MFISAKPDVVSTFTIASIKIKKNSFNVKSVGNGERYGVEFRGSCTKPTMVFRLAL